MAGPFFCVSANSVKRAAPTSGRDQEKNTQSVCMPQQTCMGVNMPGAQCMHTLVTHEHNSTATPLSLALPLGRGQQPLTKGDRSTSGNGSHRGSVLTTELRPHFVFFRSAGNQRVCCLSSFCTVPTASTISTPYHRFRALMDTMRLQNISPCTACKLHQTID
jgi:hypothetical protein